MMTRRNIIEYLSATLYCDILFSQKAECSKCAHNSLDQDMLACLSLDLYNFDSFFIVIQTHYNNTMHSIILTIKFMFCHVTILFFDCFYQDLGPSFTLIIDLTTSKKDACFYGVWFVILLLLHLVLLVLDIHVLENMKIYYYTIASY
ncbi:hypothetical protein ACJX0J_038842 [Zea mays]